MLPLRSLAKTTRPFAPNVTAAAGVVLTNRKLADNSREARTVTGTRRFISGSFQMRAVRPVSVVDPPVNWEGEYWRHPRPWTTSYYCHCRPVGVHGRTPR